MSRIKADFIVSTEAWQFDQPSSNEKDRWSYFTFGEKWRDARVYGKVKGKSGDKWIVLWSLDGSITHISSEILCLEKAIPSNQLQSTDITSCDESASDCEDPDYHPPAENHEDSVLSGGESDKNNCKYTLTEGEEVYLRLSNQTQVFKATFSYSKKGDTVHGRSVGEEKARFFIVKILKTCSKWTEFDSDVLCRGAAILWSLNHITRLQPAKNFSQLGTEARQPKVLVKRKRKRNPEKWRKNVKKSRLYEELRKYGSVAENDDGPLDNVKDSCKECRKECSTKFTEENRRAINVDFWNLKSITLQRLFITKFVKVKPKNRSRTRETTKSGRRRNRSFARCYTFAHPESGELVEVC